MASAAWCTTYVLSVFFCKWTRTHVWSIDACLVSCFCSSQQCCQFILFLRTDFKSLSVSCVNPRSKTPHAFGIPIVSIPPMPSDFQFKEPSLALGIPKSRPWYGMDILWNRPFYKSSAYLCQLRWMLGYSSENKCSSFLVKTLLRRKEFHCFTM